jgi:hypothetical protein
LCTPSTFLKAFLRKVKFAAFLRSPKIAGITSKNTCALCPATFTQRVNVTPPLSKSTEAQVEAPSLLSTPREARNLR